jgi:hypothetical protein
MLRTHTVGDCGPPYNGVDGYESKKIYGAYTGYVASAMNMIRHGPQLHL